MKPLLPLNEITKEDYSLVGSKAYALSILINNGFNIPYGICLTTDIYSEYLHSTGLGPNILFELNRKKINEMRWEEIWDISLKIRNMFLRTSIPENLENIIRKAIKETFGENPLVIRSSAPGEDSREFSFAGLHNSYVNIKGLNNIMEHIKLVWASLWTDRALLYRKELELDVEKSHMAVILQEIIYGEKSGIIFGQKNNSYQSIIEAVYGLNQGLVDGSIEPDRWVLEKKTGDLISKNMAHRKKFLVHSREGTIIDSLPEEKINKPPLSNKEIHNIYITGIKLEKLFNKPQDIEWTFKGETLYILQSRPITTFFHEKEDKRPWYLSLNRSIENLKTIRKRVEEILIPGMNEELEELDEQDLSILTYQELKEEITRRENICNKWTEIYYKEFIPLSHGIRLFGQIYNDTVKPKDPYEFMDLLSGTELISIKRNRLLENIASMIRNNKELMENLEKEDYLAAGLDFNIALEEFMKNFTCVGDTLINIENRKKGLINILLELSGRTPVKEKFNIRNFEEIKKVFFSHFKGEKKLEAAKLLEFARACYCIKDNEYIYLGKIKNQRIKALEELGRRNIILNIKDKEIKEIDSEKKEISENKETTYFYSKARQIEGQPAAPGIARGKARVIIKEEDIFNIKQREIIICDGIEPNMTFIVPLSSGIVEKKGGMLIHGAIIAREYGLPCITGVTEGTSLIKTGQEIIIDGYLGIVIIP